MCKMWEIQDYTITYSKYNISHFHNSSIQGAQTQGSAYLVLEYLPCWTTNKTPRTVILSSCVLIFLLSIPMPPKEPYCKPPGQRKIKRVLRSYESKTHVPNIFSNTKTTSTQRASFRFLRCFRLLCQPKTSITEIHSFYPPKNVNLQLQIFWFPTLHLIPPIRRWKPNPSRNHGNSGGFYRNSKPNKEWRVRFHAVCFTQKDCFSFSSGRCQFRLTV